MPVPPALLPHTFKPTWVLAWAVTVCLFFTAAGNAEAQIYFDLPTEAVKEKATRAGFEFAYSEGAPTNSSALVFRKKTDQENKLVCFLSPYGICYQFGYRVPYKAVAAVIQNLNKQLVTRETNVWENRDKTFLVTLVTLPTYTTVMYSPWKPRE